jgi:polar amino acid transport system permease protein
MMDSVAAWFRWLHQATGIKLTIFYDSYDRSRFIEGCGNTLKLSLYCLVLSLLLGALVAWLAGSRSGGVGRAAPGGVQRLRNTPPREQL